MADTIRKTVKLVGTDGPAAPSVEPLLALTPTKWAPLAAAMRAQDTLCGTANRVLARVGLAGQHEYPVDDSLATSSTDDIHYPMNSGGIVDVWRTIWGPLPRRITPGCELRMHVLYLPSGMTQRFQSEEPHWIPDGAQGGVRALVTWDNGVEQTGPHTFEISLEGSGLTDGAAPSGPGAEWPALKERQLEEIRPPSSATDPEVAEDYSEWGPGPYPTAATKRHEATIEIQIDGGARIVEVIIEEVPIAHVEDHDETDPQSVHAFQVGAGPPIVAVTQVPQIEGADGATYEEHRFGTRRLVETADWQAQRLGPAVADASSWVSEHPSPGVLQVPAPWSVDGTTPTELVSGATAYDEDGPAWIVAGAHALPRDLNEPEQILVEGSRAVIPVRVHVRARLSPSDADGGWVRLQSSDTEWIDVFIPGSEDAANYTAVGYLESQVLPDHARARLQVFAWGSDPEDTLEVWGFAVDFGAW